MSDTTLETHRIPPTGDGSSAPGSKPGDDRPFLRRYVWWFVAAGIVIVSGLLILILRTRPGYDPYGWLDWGYQTLRGTLNLGGAPSWKPFTYLFNVPYAIFGHFALWLWMLTSVSVALAGAVFGGRIAFKLTAADSEHRYAAWIAAVFAGAFVLGIQDYFHYVMSVQSDPMLVTFCLAAIDSFLNRRYGWAWWLGALAALGRPEVWPFVGLYGIWLWIKLPKMRWQVVAGALINAFLWFGVPTITNHRPNIAGQLALESPRECTTSKITCTWDRFTALNYLPVELAALLAVVLAALRRNYTVLTLGAMALGWVVVEIAFALHGFPGVPRYLFEAGALTGVLAGIAAGWLLLDASKIDRRLPSWAGVPLVAVLFLTMLPGALSQVRAEHKDVFHERMRTTEINKLAATINALGGYKSVLACGHPVVNVEYVSIMAWYTHLNTGVVGHRPSWEINTRKYPILNFIPLPNGWAIKSYRSNKINGSPALIARCSKINDLYVPTAFHPGGVLIQKARS
ncbi:MAG TPA: hypothetical protein VN880_17735 [Solirubrobacteraceae bacterium]|nr:hypothetical protein [Solirubrobacteraceae bacterium]